jgi:RsmE family RNA methyltransferase
MNIYLPILKSGWIDGNLVSHLHSLHPKIGDIYTFTNLNGSFTVGKILEINKKLSSYNIEFLGIHTTHKPSEKVLFQHQTDKLYLEKLMELMPIAEVTKIYIYNGDFSPKQNLQTERLTKILIRSCEQSHNLFLPEIELLDKQTWLQKIAEHKPKWLHQTAGTEVVVENFNSPEGDKQSTEQQYPYLGVVTEVTGVVSGSEQLISCLVGPEGGFSQKEEETYNNLKLEKVQLGLNILPAWLAGYTYFANKILTKKL